jgi:spore coat protein A
MRQRAATLWYHDHRMDFTGPQVYRGLAGFHLVTDDEQDALGLPSGERDVPLMITRPRLRRGRLRSVPRQHHGAGVTDAHMEGVLGDVVLVNGAPWPVLEVAAARYRLRLLNASTRAGTGSAWIRPARRCTDRLRRRAAGTADRAHQRAARTRRAVRGRRRLRRRRARHGADAAQRPRQRTAPRTSCGSGSPLAAATTAGSRQQLSRIEPLRPDRAVRTRTWTFRRAPSGEHPAGCSTARAFDPDRIDADVRLGEIEVWRFTSDLHHPVHVHLDPFQVLSRRGGARPARRRLEGHRGPRPSESVDVAVRFADYPGRYLLHCHNLEHEDMAMMAAFRPASWETMATTEHMNTDTRFARPSRRPGRGLGRTAFLFCA